VNRPAIHDLLGTILSAWYGSVAEWVPPGRLGPRTCTACGESLLARVMDVRAWPHDLIHELAVDLDAAAGEIADSMAEDALAVGGTLRDEDRRARRIVLATIAEQAGDITDVLSECVTPRLDRHIGLEAERGLRELDWLPDTH
jgi:hypothetical protein